MSNPDTPGPAPAPGHKLQGAITTDAEHLEESRIAGTPTDNKIIFTEVWHNKRVLAWCKSSLIVPATSPYKQLNVPSSAQAFSYFFFLSTSAMKIAPSGIYSRLRHSSSALVK